MLPMTEARTVDYGTFDRSMDRSIDGSIDRYSWELLSINRDAESSSTGVKWLWGSFIMFNTVVGFGIITLPAAVQRAGSLELALVIEALVIVLLYSCILATGFVCTEHTIFPSFESLFLHYFANWAKTLVSVLITVVCFFACISYLVGIREQFGMLVTANISPALTDRWFIQPNFLLFAVSLVVILPFLLVQFIEHLRQASLVASLCVAYLVCVVAAAYFYPEELLNPVLLERGQHVGQNEPAMRWFEKLACLTSFVFAYSFTFATPPIYAKTLPKTFRAYTKMVSLTFAACIVVYNIIIVGFVMSMDRPLADNALLNLNPRAPAAIVAYVLYILKLSLEYPVLAFLGRQGILSVLPAYWVEPRPVGVKVLISVIWYTTTLGLTLLVNGVMEAVQITGVHAPHSEIKPSNPARYLWESYVYYCPVSYSSATPDYTWWENVGGLFCSRLGWPKSLEDFSSVLLP